MQTNYGWWVEPMQSDPQSRQSLKHPPCVWPVGSVNRVQRESLGQRDDVECAPSTVETRLFMDQSVKVRARRDGDVGNNSQRGQMDDMKRCNDRMKSIDDPRTRG